MFNFYSNDLEIVLSIILITILVSIFSIIIYDFIKSRGKLEISILKMKIDIINKDNWQSEDNKLKKETKALELDFIFQVCNNKNNYNNIHD